MMRNNVLDNRNTNKTQQVSFYEDLLWTAVAEDKTCYVAMKPIIIAFELRWESHFKKLTRNAERWGIAKMAIPTNSGTQEMLCIPVAKLHGYLCTISVSRLEGELKAKLLRYQNECDDFLHKHWSNLENSRCTDLIQSINVKSFPCVADVADNDESETTTKFSDENHNNYDSLADSMDQESVMPTDDNREATPKQKCNKRPQQKWADRFPKRFSGMQKSVKKLLDEFIVAKDENSSWVLEDAKQIHDSLSAAEKGILALHSKIQRAVESLDTIIEKTERYDKKMDHDLDDQSNLNEERNEAEKHLEAA